MGALAWAHESRAAIEEACAELLLQDAAANGLGVRCYAGRRATISFALRFCTTSPC
ncbi:hypothetical protein SBC1_41190 (plasmid) [Caballeronia sp. SBC1]|nr:hypothetical protein SBC2_46750 [Caballeronia sp. SBC2]QIN64079.1 hypothetical protein SBC1_41190 [Caballeronia sp. SBC1]